MCHVLQYLCDCQVRHRIEAVVAFSDDFVACLQNNQRFRYNEVMLALNMSAALTAKKTKEFRSPPQEQVGTPLKKREAWLEDKQYVRIHCTLTVEEYRFENMKLGRVLYLQRRST